MAFQRSPSILLIPDTSSMEHLRENLLQRYNFLLNWSPTLTRSEGNVTALGFSRRIGAFGWKP